MKDSDRNVIIVRMRYPAKHKVETRARLLAAAGRGFRRRGYGGIGVDGLAKEAEVTSGAFYIHFPSKEDAFKQVVVHGLEVLRDAVAELQASHGEGWVEPFVDWYLGYKRTCELGDSCALQSLSPEVARSDSDIRMIYQDALLEAVEQVAKGLKGSPTDRRKRAWALLSIVAGAVSLARAVDAADVSKQIATSVRSVAIHAARG
jgi:TetR/AcrR family transcriptional repressor of nem operon